MRTSNRTKILDAIVTIVQRDGVTAVTFDAVAAETGLTRGGLLYHFPSREALILAAHTHLAAQWEAGMEKNVGGNADHAQPTERDAAYIRSCAQAARRVELLMMLESANEPEFDALWRGVLDRWAPPVPDVNDPASLSRFIARLAADGLWVHEVLSNRPLPTKLKERICGELETMAGGTPRSHDDARKLKDA